ncbi:MAG: 50S ribosomal protein L21 [Clostridiales bacterium]|nr:50S ribosomal protein L21 [Clostridiales bacterium]
MYAVFQIGSKQYKVAEGDVIRTEKLDTPVGGSVPFETVMLIADGENVSFGAPYISGAKVSASVTAHGDAKKIIVMRYKPKKGYHKKKGHRQPYTELTITSITK